MRLYTTLTVDEYDHFEAEAVDDDEPPRHGVVRLREFSTDLLAADGPPVQARFAGSCPHCGQRYAPGMTIGHVEDVGWVCEDCLT